MKERVTLTLEKKILDAIDKKVDGLRVRNRSHAIEMALTKYLNFKELDTALILCGGEGTRLRPITYEIPKPLIPVHDKPLLDHLLDLFSAYEVNNIFLSIGHMKDKVKNEFQSRPRPGMNINFIEEERPLGTAGPLKLAKSHLTKSFVVSNGDELKNIDIRDMFETHKQSKALATIALTTVSDPSHYGVARLEGNRIIEFVEKPTREDAPSQLINAGFYIIEPEVIDMIPDGFAMLEKHIFPKLAKQGKLFGFPFSGQWFDTGNMERYERALKEWKGIKV